MTKTSSEKTPRFDLGQVVVTRRVYDEVSAADIQAVLRRHQAGDWGAVEPEDAEANERALDIGARLLSAYMIGGFRKIWIITEADRSATTVLFPEEY